MQAAGYDYCNIFRILSLNHRLIPHRYETDSTFCSHRSNIIFLRPHGNTVPGR